MERDIDNLRSICAALMATDFAAIDRLKAILQVAYEILNASSIVAYKYDRITEQLEIFAMPGVRQREMMRGPTPEAIFKWDPADPDNPPTGKWLENTKEYKEYLEYLRGLISHTETLHDKDTGDDFRDRELKKHGEKGDLALAKICLYKGVGQTLDPVGQLFFNFPKKNPKEKVFSNELRSAIRYVSAIVRELLIEELYHLETAEKQHRESPFGSLRLLRIINDKLKDAKYVTRVSVQKLSEELWELVCKAALSLVETYGGQADIILVIGEKLGRRFILGQRKRVVPSLTDSQDEYELIWLRSGTITDYCRRKGKVFVCNNVKEKASDYFRKCFDNEPYVEQYNSLMVMPIIIDGEVHAVLRLMSMDKDCFLDRHTQAIQDIAFVASYAFRQLNTYQRQDRISDGLSFFAEGQAVAEYPNLEELLQKALQVLGADYAVFWPIDKSRTSKVPFGRGVCVEASGKLPPESFEPRDPHYGVRDEGLTSQIYRLCVDSTGDIVFCLHVLDELRQSEPDFPEYALQVFSDNRESWQKDAKKTPDMRFKSDYDSTQPFPGTEQMISLSGSSTEKSVHTQIGFAIKEKNANEVQAIAWICFKNLHPLGWWERLYVRGLSNYLAQALRATGLRLAIRSFHHMIPGVCGEVYLALEPKEKQKHYHVEGRPSPRSQETIMSMASDVLYMTLRKAGEVNALLKTQHKVAAFPLIKIGEVFHRAWAIATNLGTQSRDFKIEEKPPLQIEKAPGFTIVYGPGIRPDDGVNGAMYTAAVNILKNAVDYGKEPFVTWAFLSENSVKVIFADGGQLPEPNLLSTDGRADYKQKKLGVGLAVVKKILQQEDGKIRLMRLENFKNQYPKAPAHMNACKTFFEVLIPCNERY